MPCTQANPSFSQLWALGRAAIGDVLKNEDPKFEVVSASDVPITRASREAVSDVLKREDQDSDVVTELNPPVIPHPLANEKIQEYIHLYAKAASNAFHRAGFNGVEIHDEPCVGHVAVCMLMMNSATPTHFRRERILD
jgi:NADPH2 dehydrogenase